MVRLWIREGSTKPVKCLAPGTMPKIAVGRVVDVSATTLPEALKILRLAGGDAGPAPDTKNFATLWDWSQQKAAIEMARTMIREVSRA